MYATVRRQPFTKRFVNPLDLSAAGLGQHTLATAIGLLVGNHIGTETGEISVLKGIQGARGYPI